MAALLLPAAAAAAAAAHALAAGTAAASRKARPSSRRAGAAGCVSAAAARQSVRCAVRQETLSAVGLAGKTSSGTQPLPLQCSNDAAQELVGLLRAGQFDEALQYVQQLVASGGSAKDVLSTSGCGDKLRTVCAELLRAEQGHRRCVDALSVLKSVLHLA